MTAEEQLVADLKAAKAVIDSPEKWTKGALAKDDYGVEVPVSAEEAVCFCASGAVNRAIPGGVTPVDRRVAVRRALRHSIAASFPNEFTLVVSFNDSLTTTHADIMALFDRAIATAEASVKAAV